MDSISRDSDDRGGWLLVGMVFLAITAACRPSDRLPASATDSVATAATATVPQAVTLVPEAPPPLPAVTTGPRQACAITGAGDAYCWGGRSNWMAQTRRPLPFGESIRWRMVSVAFDRGCGLDVEGATYCWGSNAEGQLGVAPDSLRHPAPVRITGLPPLLNLATAQGHTCGLTADGEAYCWGENQNGELGRGTRTPWEAAGPVVGDLGFVSVVTILNTTCALTPAGEPYCWGLSMYGEVGYRPEESCADVHPVNIPGTRPLFLCSTLPGAVETDLRFNVYDLTRHRTCGVTLSGDGYCWATTAYPEPALPSPKLVADGFALKSITVAGAHRCALTETGQAVCEGRNERDQLGVADSPLRYRMLSAGDDFTCGMTVQNRVFCWGRDWDRGVLGPVTGNSAEAVEIRIPGLEK